MSDKPTHTPLPWFSKMASKPDDGEYNCAIAAEIDGKNHCIGKTFGRVDYDVRPDAQANASFIVQACNSHDNLVEALETVLDLMDNGELVRNITRDSESDFSIRILEFTRKLSKITAALSKAQGEHS